MRSAWNGMAKVRGCTAAGCKEDKVVDLTDAVKYLKRLRKACEDSSRGVIRIEDVTELDNVLVEVEEAITTITNLQHDLQRMTEHAEIPIV